MPDLMDRLYCSEQIHIPPTFPFIMKLYCKAAIRTQPYDLLKWSAAYFRALANGEEPPVKDRIEYPPYDSPTGLTPGYIRMLIKQLGKNPETEVNAQTIFVKWNCVCLEDELLIKLMALMGARTSFNWLKFIAIACGFISTSLTNTMILICEMLTDEPEGGMASIPAGVFNDLYLYLAQMECGPLSEEELKALEDLDIEEDAAVIAEKIRTAIYYGEAEGMFAPEEVSDLVMKESLEETEIMPEGKDSILENLSTKKEPETPEAQAKDRDEEEAEGEKGEESEGGDSKDELLDVKISESKDFAGVNEIEDHPGEASVKEERSSEEEFTTQRSGSASPTEMEEEEAKTEEDRKTEQIPEQKQARKIKLEDIEESVRRQIQEKLEADTVEEGSVEGFEDLNSYLLDAAARVRKYTAEEIGYRIFKKFLRQEVPGIGPAIDRAEIDKVLDFMDFSSHKQEGMVMPRNIRHWMCPPLDKVPLPEP